MRAVMRIPVKAFLWAGALFLLSALAATADIQLAREEPFPVARLGRILKRVEVERIEVPCRLRYRLSCPNDYVRFFRVYVNGHRVYLRLIKPPSDGVITGVIDLSSAVASAGVYEILLEIEMAAHRPWNLEEARLEGAEGRLLRLPPDPEGNRSP